MEDNVIELINKYNVFYVFYNKSCLAVAIDKGFIWTNPTLTYRITHLHPIRVSPNGGGPVWDILWEGTGAINTRGHKQSCAKPKL